MENVDINHNYDIHIIFSYTCNECIVYVVCIQSLLYVRDP